MSFDVDRFEESLKAEASSLDEGDLTAALGALESFAAGTAVDSEAQARVRWLIGRIHQERYLRSDPGSNQAREALERAVSAFHESYRSAPDRFPRHGVSALALLARGRRDGIVLSGFPVPEILATEILDALDVREREGRLEEPADLAAAAEACVALGRLVEALVWTRRYVRKETDPVELTATLRQLTQVWRLDEDGDAEGRLLSTLRDHLPQPTRSLGTRSVEEPPPGPAHLPPEKPLAAHEDVVFTVYKPSVVPPGVWVPLLAFAHLEDLPDEERRPDEPSIREQVQAQAEAALGERLPGYTDASEDSSQGIPHEAEITFVPFVPGIRFNPPQATFLFLEAIHKEEFRMAAPPSLDGRTARGRLSVYWGRILLAELNLKVRVDSRVRQAVAAQEPETERESIRPYRDIFASYSHRDTDIVLEFERYAQAMGDRYLIDRNDLRAGEVWDERLQGMIREADAFQLFWSRNAMQSPFVEKEWRYALALGREKFIRPVYWEDPLPELPERNLPPEDLRRLHFYRFPGGKAASPGGTSPGGSGMAQGAEMTKAGGEIGTGSISVAVTDDAEPEAMPSAALGPKPRRRRLAWIGSLAAALLAIVVSLPLLMTGSKIDDGDDIVFREDTLSLEPPGEAELRQAAVVIRNEGVTLAQEGAVPEETPTIVPGPENPPGDFVATEAIIASIPVEDVAAGTPVTIVLTRPDGTTVEEMKTVEAGAENLRFELDESTLRELGGYKAEVFVGAKREKIKATERVFQVEAGPPPG